MLVQELESATSISHDNDVCMFRSPDETKSMFEGAEFHTMDNQRASKGWGIHIHGIGLEIKIENTHNSIGFGFHGFDKTRIQN